MTDTALPGLFLGQSLADDGAQPQVLRFDRANRHGVVAGAIGTLSPTLLAQLQTEIGRCGVRFQECHNV